jgi:hypothetical protein
VSGKNTFPNKKHQNCWPWWHTPVILVLGKQRQENHEFVASLDYENLFQKEASEPLIL